MSTPIINLIQLRASGPSSRIASLILSRKVSLQFNFRKEQTFLFSIEQQNSQPLEQVFAQLRKLGDLQKTISCPSCCFLLLLFPLAAYRQESGRLACLLLQRKDGNGV